MRKLSIVLGVVFVWACGGSAPADNTGSGGAGAHGSSSSSSAGHGGAGGHGSSSSTSTTNVTTGGEGCYVDDGASAQCAKSDPAHPVSCLCPPNAEGDPFCGLMDCKGDLMGAKCCAKPSETSASTGAGGAGGASASSVSTGGSGCYLDDNASADCAKSDPAHPVACVCPPNAEGDPFCGLMDCKGDLFGSKCCAKPSDSSSASSAGGAG
jgi:hypothetical protein